MARSRLARLAVAWGHYDRARDEFIDAVRFGGDVEASRRQLHLARSLWTRAKWYEERWRDRYDRLRARPWAALPARYRHYLLFPPSRETDG